VPWPAAYAADVVSVSAVSRTGIEGAPTIYRR